MSAREVSAALAVAREHGISCDTPVVLRDLTNVLVHLAPAPVVARVPVTLVRLRGKEWESRVVELASFLAGEGAPIARPSPELPPGPHVHDRVVVSFWEHVDHDPKRFDADAAGRSLCDLHRALAAYDGLLPRFERLDEVERVTSTLREPDAAVLRDALARLEAGATDDARPLHGDAHLRNVLWAEDGPRWTDLENACVGPIEYDLAAIAWRASDGTEEALAAYGRYDEDELARVTPFLAVFLAAWTLDLAERHPSARPGAEERLERVRQWLRQA